MRQLLAYECYQQRGAPLMRLTRVFVDGELTPGSVVELARDTASHLAKVLRARSGDEIVLFNGDGREYLGAIETLRGSRISAAIGAARSADRESPFAITLVQCVPRGDRMDFIVQKATELGVARIVPVLSQRSVVRLDESQAVAKQSHWQAVAVSACEQCGRNRLPRVEAARPLLNYLGDSGSGVSPQGILRLILEPDHPQQPHRGERAAGAEIAIGPEGGFAPEELEAFALSSFVRVGLGPRVLRTETAAIAAVVVLQARYGDMSGLSDNESRAADA
jgi:16S rRNA (uracil1498-N3)-methyltransferase